MLRREYPEAPILAVGAIVLNGDHVLLIRRSQPPLQGEWSIPGGAVDLGETLAEAVCREVAEETGVEVRVVQLVDVLDRIVLEDAGLDGASWARAGSASGPAGVQRVRYHYVLADFLCVPIGGALRSGSDAADACWAVREMLGGNGLYPMAALTLAVIEKAFQIASAAQERSP